MSIKYNENTKIFNLSTPNTTYLIGLLNSQLIHLHYGKKIISDAQIFDIYKYSARAFSAQSEPDGTENVYSDDVLPMEFPCYGSADLRMPAFHARYADGSTVTKLTYKSHSIKKGKPALVGLPAFYVENDNEADTLEIELVDELTGLLVVLSYTVYNERDIITRSVKIVNNGDKNAELLRVMSMNVDMFDSDYDFVHLWGAWAKERHIQKCPLINGGQYIDSKRTSSSHHHNPFFAISRKNATEYEGEVYGFGLVYSSNFIGGAEVDAQGTTRCYLGINDFNFRWILEPNTEFQAPEVVMTYSDNGFNKMSNNFHKAVQKRLCRGNFRDKERPVLINNWEATYFDFDEQKIVDIATTAKELGVDLMVLDDGWFGKRDDDHSSLGDWFVDKKKLPNGIDGLAKKIDALGMKFGLWFEPEMVSPDSDLYRAHPDWAIHIEGRKCSLGRNQLVLDLSRDDVCEYIIGFLSDILSSAPISYVKWDMNRNITEAGSLLLSPEKQQEFSHRYILGLYRVLETVMAKFPDVLFEGCSGGGGRFDLGMFYYFPQYWTSDDSDAVERMYIQYGSSMLYPSTVMGAHVSAVPNHQVGRVTSVETRGNVAMMGRLGYELDLAKLSDEEKEVVKEQIKAYKKWGEVIHNADMYRLKSPFKSNEFSVEFVSEDKKNVIVIYATILGKPNPQLSKIYFKGLDKTASYKNIQTGVVYGGDVLENIGLTMENKGDFSSEMLIFEKI